MAFSCHNNKYKTNVDVGFPHGNDNSGGSVTRNYLSRAENGATLWFEYVIGTEDSGDRCYWFMWYDANGKPLINRSAVVDLKTLSDLQTELAHTKIDE